jgi:hypothetical protein
MRTLTFKNVLIWRKCEKKQIDKYGYLGSGNALKLQLLKRRTNWRIYAGNELNSVGKIDGEIKVVLYILPHYKRNIMEQRDTIAKQNKAKQQLIKYIIN